MNTNTRANNTDNKVIREFDYHKLSKQQTTQLVESALNMIDLHFNCDGEYLSTCKDTDNYTYAPYKIFDKIEPMFRHLCQDEADTRFLDYVINNTTKPFKWWKFNGESVNLSQAQLQWWSKQFKRYGIDNEFLHEVEERPETTATVAVAKSPRYSELFE